jgi:hypothetical protein
MNTGARSTARKAMNRCFMKCSPKWEWASISAEEK